MFRATEVLSVVFREFVSTHGLPDQDPASTRVKLRLGNTGAFSMELRVNGVPHDRVTELVLLSKVPGHKQLVLTANVSKITQRGFSGKERDSQPPDIRGNFLEPCIAPIRGPNRDPRVRLFFQMCLRANELMGEIPEDFPGND